MDKLVKITNPTPSTFKVGEPNIELVINVIWLAKHPLNYIVGNNIVVEIFHIFIVKKKKKLMDPIDHLYRTHSIIHLHFTI